MCGRFSLVCSKTAIAQTFNVSSVPDFIPQYNIAPAQTIATIRQDLEQQERQFQLMHWGLIPHWAKDEKIGYKLINARVETVTEKPAFRQAIRSQRCLILADGFYEWQHQGKTKQPYYFQLENHQPFGFAGLWERWNNPNGEENVSCTILTQAANETVRLVHERMPIILSPTVYSQWLDPTLKDSETILSLVQHNPNLRVYPVSSKVNRATYNQPDCILPLDEAVEIL
ncbi:Putative SOS response-associated peptidase yoqW [Planktothrix tepida]|uniref:Abasic site processing protein n=1 Tax=Planktothrix tepida PCC 9214 TaxID=671072 RepID=A0A1J1LKN8_9CYAN|nr:SOS response-associated peptidase [Planktothrix tepida]CAD5984636.1 Putative SOS response-associated peptidase yoqW [Planktothrix tepida]CUR32169.1 conserved hypothetical protein [Planktothrix tepida PCC 9214]